MRARTAVTIDGGRVERLRCEPPLTLRRVGTDDGRVGLCLVGTAAGPLPGDDLGLEIHLRDDARVRLRATGASIAQGLGGARSNLAMRATLDDGTDLDADPGPLIVGRDSHVDVSVCLELARTASVRWRELVVLGRTLDAEPGRVTLRWNVTRGGRPVLRQLTDLAAPALRRWRGMTDGHRVLATELRTGPDILARTVVASPTAVAQRVDAQTVLVTVLADSAADAIARLAGFDAETRPAIPSGHWGR